MRSATRDRVLSIALGLGLLAIVAMRLAGCSGVSSVLGTSQSSVGRLPAATAEATVNASCIVCVARATEEARTASGGATSPTK